MSSRLSRRRRQENTPIDVDALFADSSLNGMEDAMRLHMDMGAVYPSGPVRIESPRPDMEFSNGSAEGPAIEPTEGPMKGTLSEALIPLPPSIKIRPTIAARPPEGPMRAPTGGPMPEPSEGSVSSGAWWTSADRHFTVERSRTFPIRTVQDCLTPLEQSRCNLLWFAVDAGDFRVLQKTATVKVFQAGYGTLARLLRVNERSVRRKIIPGLVEKCILELKETGRTEGRERIHSTWCIYSYGEILKRQRAQNFVRGMRYGNGIHLVRPFTGEALGIEPPVGPMMPPTEGLLRAPTEGSLNGPAVGDIMKPAEGAVPKMPEGAVIGPTGFIGPTEGQKPSGAGGPNGDRSLLDTFSTRRRTGAGGGPVENFPAEFAELMEREGKYLDEGALLTIWRSCRLLVDDATPEEIRDFFHPKAEQVYRDRTVANPTAVLLKTIMEWFPARRVYALRKEKKEAEENARKTRAELEVYLAEERARSAGTR